MANDYEEDIINRWLKQELSNEEASEQLGESQFLKYKQILTEIDHWTPDNEPLDLSPEMITQKGKVITMTRWMPIAVAATVVLTMFLGIWFLQVDQTTYQANLGQIKEILLPDGLSRVILASNSSVSWEEGDWNDKQRLVKLDGKAFFKVNPGSPFSVLTNSGNVQVLGTSFEVDDFAGAMLVQCFEGKVKAVATNKEERIVAGGESILFYQGSWEEKKSVSGDMPNWILNETAFNNAPLTQVLKMLKDQYGLEAETDHIDTNRRFTGTVPNNNLKLALQLIFTPLNIQYQLEDKQLILTE